MLQGLSIRKPGRDNDSECECECECEWGCGDDGVACGVVCNDDCGGESSSEIRLISACGCDDRYTYLPYTPATQTKTSTPSIPSCTRMVEF
ncbi:hypothetical protein AX774_g5789 [Zancudomyces culisetae]|uniref:Uncharacterized protein n=1 Tax=Zancudomyces culisetae TaxID=1213189 RepID=A0A1R1PII2_ZANCU|nr:hypothetical protein AX774_g5789 [Zancudomyces culisetae]|eukprot:OMH80767.1 hypothetical protein AX774_g5789 [Zancudomyces culisetae]